MAELNNIDGDPDIPEVPPDSPPPDGECVSQLKKLSALNVALYLLSSTFFVLAVVFTTLYIIEVTKPSKPEFCPFGWFHWSGSCYSSSEKRYSFDINITCHHVDINSRLVAVKSEEENNFLYNAFVKRTGEDYYLGIVRDIYTQSADKNEFVTIDLQKLVYTNWKPARPSVFEEDKNLEDDCVVISTEKGKWKDVPCRFGYRSICMQSALHRPKDPVDPVEPKRGEKMYKTTFKSCKDAKEKLERLERSVVNQNEITNGAYKIEITSMSKLTFTNAYCHMSHIEGCGREGGWTLVMKIDGDKDTFNYSSPLWSNTEELNSNCAGHSGFDSQETKLGTYWSTPFSELCVGMRYPKNSKNITFFSIPYKAPSLHSLIADGKYRKTEVGRKKWESLIIKPSLQEGFDREGFNADWHTSTIGRPDQHMQVRLGIIGDEDNKDLSPDSYIGFGGPGKRITTVTKNNVCGNLQTFPAEKKASKTAMCYILVR